MLQWVLLLALLVASLWGGAAAAKPSDGAAAQLYSAASSRQQRVQLAPGAAAVLHNAPLEVVARLLVAGAAGRPATISCSKDGPPAFIVRGTTLELQHVVVTGCSKQAIVLKGPGAALKASSVTFTLNGPTEAATASAARSQPLGLVIAAEEATVELTNVTITGNNGVRFARTAAVPLWRPFLHPACKDDSAAGGITGRGNDDSATPDREFSTDPRLAGQQACGSPLLVSSLIDLEQSTLVLRGCRLQDNTADALITARGSSAHSLQLLPGTRLEGNRGRWLIVADSWTHDPVGRKNLKAPQPSEAVKGLDMEPPYTSYALMGNLRSPTASRDDDEGGARKLLQQQQQGQQGQQQQEQVPQLQPRLEQPDVQQEQQEQVSPDAAVGTAPKGQVPLQVRLQGVAISHNVVQSGLLWLRLVNTSMQDTDIMYNIGTGGRSSVVRQMHAVLAKLPAALAEAGQRALANDSEPAALAAQVAAAGSIVPPGPCDVGSLQRSLLIMHGPSAFDMLRCRVSHNVHFSGAVLRVTDGLGPTSLRNSMLVNNTATAVLRFEGRTWVLKTDTFFAGIQFLDVLFYTQFQGASQAAYKFAELQHAQQQASKDKVSYDAFWFMSNTSMVNNTVFHSLVMSKGSRTSWRSFLAQKADILQSGGADAANKAKTLPLINLSTSWWMRGCTLEGNRLQLPAGSTTNIVTSNTGPFSSKAGSPVRSGDRAGSQGQGSSSGSAQAPGGSASNSSSRTGDAGAARKAAPYPNEWIEAVPYAAYSDVLSAVLDADESLLSKLSQGGDACHDALKKAVDQQQEQLTLQVMLRASAPAVLWASTTQGYIEQSNIASNGGFFHTLRMDNAYVTWKDVTLINNTAAFSVFDLWFGDAWVEQADVIGNQVQSGSIWNFESFRGRFQNILLEGNKAGSARPSDLAGIMLDDANCKKKPPKPPKHPVLRGTPSSASTPSSDTPTTGSGATLSPIWRMSHFLGELHRTTLKNNTGSIALDISGMALAAPLSELLVEANNASGIRLLLPEPKYDNQSIELSDVWVVGNSLSPAAPLVGGLLLGGFTSGVGATMPVALTRCRFVNNTPIQPVDTLTLQGGGLCIQGPAADSSDDPMSQHGFLQKLSITMTKTQVEGNVAAEGGGLWTAWPMIIEDCSFKNNHAVVSGGGIYAKGLQQDSLGAFGALIINHTSIINNTASFGGGIACDSCRAILAAQVDGNKAIRNVSLDKTNASSIVWAASSGGSSSSNGGSNGGSGCGNGTSGGISSLNPARRLRHAVLGAGGGIAANLAGNSYVVVCVSGNGTSLDDRGRSTLRYNAAQALGGAVYLNSTMIAPDCPFPQPGPALTETCFPGGYWPKKCGFNTLDLDWQGSLASAGGDLVAWAGDTSGFNMACTLTGAACSVNNGSLQEAGNATSSRAGGRRSNSNSSSVNEQGIWIRQGPAGGAAGRSSSPGGGAQQTCVRTFDAQAPYVCAAGFGLADRNIMLVDETRKFQLPASFYVYNTTCIQETSNVSRSWQACAVAGDIPHEIPRVFSGDTMNLTVSLGTTQQRLHPTMRQDAVIGIVQLQQPPDGSLFVIGDIRQQMQMGLATFNNMALQPVTPPISNREYEFRFVPAWGSGNDLLRQVKHVSVNVLLLRCTLGMHMTINRCVRCSANGTYSLNPFTNETIGCQPCPNGGLCQNGLLAPRIGYYSYNPFVPQILPCPLKGACTGGRRAEWGLPPAVLKELQRQSQGGPGSVSRPLRPNVWQDAWDWGSPMTGRRLLAGAGEPGSQASQGVGSYYAAGYEGAEGAEKQRRSGSFPRQHRLPDMHELQDGTDTEGEPHLRAQQQQQQQPVVVSRRAALMGYNKLLAQLWANDSRDGMPLLMGVEFSELLDSWHRLQCNPGYTGLFCGRCDLNYVEPMLLAEGRATDPLGAADREGDRYGLHMGSCVRCQSPAVIGLALFGLFLLLFAYNAFGMCMQLRNSGIRDPYLRFARSLAAQQGSQQPSGQLQPQGSGWTGSGLLPSGSSGTLARASSSSSSQASQSQGQGQSQHAQASQHGSQQQSQVGNCYSVNTVISTQLSYGFAVPYTAVGGGGQPGLPLQGSVLRPGTSQQLLVRTNTMPASPLAAQRQMSMPAASSLQQQGSSAGPLSPMGSLGSPFLQQAHLAPLAPLHSGQQYPRQQQQQQQQFIQHQFYQQQQPPQQSVPISPLHAAQGQQRASWAGSNSSWDAAGGPGPTATSSGLPRASTMPHSSAAQVHTAAAAHPGTSGDPTAAVGGAAAGGTAAAGTGAGGSSSAASPQGGPPAAAGGSSFVFVSQQDQQQPRDQQRQTSPHQGQWWSNGATVNGTSPQRQQSLPPPGPQQQHHSALPPLPHPQHSTQPAGSMQQAGSMRHRHQSSVLNSVASSQVQSAGQRSSSGRGAGGSSSPGNAGSSHSSRRNSNSSRTGSNSQQQQPQQQQQRQQQQQGFRKGPAALLVGLWKVLTSYLQVLGTIRHISLRALPEMSAQALAWADLSTFTSFVALDCLLPGPQEWHAFIKLFARTIALPVLLLLASALMWTTCWLFRHLALRLHRKYGHRHNLRWQPLRQMQRHARVAPDPLKAYLSPRMLITLVVLSYSLYPLVTSGLLYTLQCTYIPGPFAAEAAAVEYSRGHYDWLQQRQAAANSSAGAVGVRHSSGGGGGVGSAGMSDIQLCRPGQGALESGLCWVTGRFWAMDYDVQCFVGHHRAVAYFGLVMLLLVGVAFPVAAASLLWYNRRRLDEWDFAWKWSFLYAEYNQNTCFWEFIIMGRKLAFLAATILLPMALDTPEETTAQMQLLVCVLLAVTFLLLHASLHPFKRGVLNRLERLGLTAIALSCTLLAASLVVEKGRLALLVILGLVNVTVVAIFLYHIIRQLWLWIGAPASKAVGTAYRSSKDWWKEKVAARVRPHLEGWARCWQWPPACWEQPGGSWAGSCLGRIKGWCCWRRGADESKQEGDDQQQQQQQQDAATDGHVLSSPPPPQQQQQADSQSCPAQQQRKRKQKPQGQQAAANGHHPQPPSPAQQQQQQLANGHVPQQANGHVQQAVANGHHPQPPPPPQQQQQPQLANGHVPQQANGHVQQLQANACPPPALQQQQQQQQPPPPASGQGQAGPPQHSIHQIQLVRR